MLTQIEQLPLHLGNGLLHLLAEERVPNCLEAIKKLLQSCPLEVKNRLLSHRNFAGKTPLHIATNYNMRRFLEWSDEQQDGYLQTPPVVLLMYTTENRDGAERESQNLERALPEFGLEVCKVVNPSKEEMTSAILQSVEGKDDVSALMVIIMSHGAQGIVCADDGDVSIQEILLQMQGAVAEGRPKVNQFSQYA